VKLDPVVSAHREGRADGLIHDDISRQQSLIRIEHEHALDRCRSLPDRPGAGQVENQEHGGAETEKSYSPHQRLRPILGRKRHGYSGLGGSARFEPRSALNQATQHSERMREIARKYNSGG
jgi:hypothetical protein